MNTTDEMFLQFQKDWQKQVQKFMLKGYKMHSNFKDGQLPPPGMTETLLFGIMWKIFEQAMDSGGPKFAEVEKDFLTDLFNKIMTGKGPSVFHYQDSDGNDVNPDLSNTKPIIH